MRTLRMTPVRFEVGARPHRPDELYRSYLDQSDVFVGIYWESYGWVGPDATVSGIEDELERSRGRPQLIYVKEPSPNRDPALHALLDRIREGALSTYRRFGAPGELSELVLEDLAVLLSERFQSGRVSHRDLPDGTVTFVFVDMADSTRIAGELPGSYPAIVGAFQTALVETVVQHGGVVVDTEGDGAFCVFSTVDDAATAAVAFQRDVLERSWPDDAPVLARIGIHAGAAERTADNYVGLEVHRAARIGAAANGGQILVSRSAANLIGATGRLAAGRPRLVRAQGPRPRGGAAAARRARTPRRAADATSPGDAVGPPPCAAHRSRGPRKRDRGRCASSRETRRPPRHADGTRRHRKDSARRRQRRPGRRCVPGRRVLRGARRHPHHRSGGRCDRGCPRSPQRGCSRAPVDDRGPTRLGPRASRPGQLRAGRRGTDRGRPAARELPWGRSRGDEPHAAPDPRRDRASGTAARAARSGPAVSRARPSAGLGSGGRRARGRRGDLSTPRRPAPRDRARRCAHAHSRSRVAPGAPEPEARRRRRQRSRSSRAPAHVDGDHRVELRPPRRSGADVTGATRRVRRWMDARGRGDRVQRRRRIRRAHRARTTQRAQPARRGAGLGTGPADADARDDPGVRDRAARGEHRGGRAARASRLVLRAAHRRAARPARRRDGPRLDRAPRRRLGRRPRLHGVALPARRLRAARPARVRHVAVPLASRPLQRAGAVAHGGVRRSRRPRARASRRALPALGRGLLPVREVRAGARRYRRGGATARGDRPDRPRGLGANGAGRPAALLRRRPRAAVRRGVASSRALPGGGEPVRPGQDARHAGHHLGAPRSDGRGDVAVRGGHRRGRAARARRAHRLPPLLPSARAPGPRRRRSRSTAISMQRSPRLCTSKARRTASRATRRSWPPKAMSSSPPRRSAPPRGSGSARASPCGRS